MHSTRTAADTAFGDATVGATARLFASCFTRNAVIAISLVLRPVALHVRNTIELSDQSPRSTMPFPLRQQQPTADEKMTAATASTKKTRRIGISHPLLSHRGDDESRRGDEALK